MLSCLWEPSASGGSRRGGGGKAGPRFFSRIASLSVTVGCCSKHTHAHAHHRWLHEIPVGRRGEKCCRRRYDGAVPHAKGCISLTCLCVGDLLDAFFVLCGVVGKGEA